MSKPEEVYPKGYTLFGDGIKINDINQGKVGDCYFVSSLAS